MCERHDKWFELLKEEDRKALQVKIDALQILQDTDTAYKRATLASAFYGRAAEVFTPIGALRVATQILELSGYTALREAELDRARNLLTRRAAVAAYNRDVAEQHADGLTLEELLQHKIRGRGNNDPGTIN